jgi:hypothetical protein
LVRFFHIWLNVNDCGVRIEQLAYTAKTKTPQNIFKLSRPGRCQAINPGKIHKRQGDERVGQWSDIVSLPVAG